MKRSIILSALLCASVACSLFAQAPAAPANGGRAGRGGRGAGAAAAGPDVATMRKEWVDADTGHRVFRLSTENNAGNLYFHYNAYSADGKKLIFSSPSGIMAADLATKQAELIVPGATPMETARASNEVFYIAGGAVMAADLTTKKTRQVVALPAGMRVSCVNCDGTLFAGTLTNQVDPDGNDKAAKPDRIPADDQIARMFPGKTRDQLTAQNISSGTKENGLAARLKAVVTAPNPQCLFTLNAKTGEVKKFGYAYAWLNHLQFSPTDPNFLMICHEGTWHETDRVWTIKVNEPNAVAKKMHERTVDMEIWGHEWFAPDGKSVGFDLQMPRSENFFIARVDLAPDGGPAKETRYKLDKNWWGIHFAMSKDGKMYASDGGDSAQVSFAPDGMWINLLRVQPDGTIAREKLVNMSKHNYVTAASGGINGVEPNVTFSPDDKYVIFAGTFDGARHVYAVEVAKAQ